MYWIPKNDIIYTSAPLGFQRNCIKQKDFVQSKRSICYSHKLRSNKLIHNLFFSKVDANNVIADEINPPYAKLRL